MNLIEVENLSKHYKISGNFSKDLSVKALQEVSFVVKENETLGIVGESGCGKSTLAKTLIKLEEITGGEVKIRWKDNEMISLKKVSSKKLPEFFQMIFQDPYSSLNPRKKAWELIAAPLFIKSKISKADALKEAQNMMKKVGLAPELAFRYPHMFSGGQRQRIGLARALITRPKVILCDEPVSALDVSIQAQVLNLLMEIQQEFNLTYIFISHDLSVVKHLSNRIIVMYLGKIVEYGNRDDIFKTPLHPYTKALMASSPSLNMEQISPSISGELPSPISPPKGCAFHKRCPEATEKCSQSTPELKKVNDQFVSCFLFSQPVEITN